MNKQRIILLKNWLIQESFLAKMLGAFLFYGGCRPKKLHDKRNRFRRFCNILFFTYYDYLNKNVPNREFNESFWRQFGFEYLKTMDQIPIGKEYMQEVCRIISKKDIKGVLELGCGFGRHLKFLAKEYPYVELYGIEIVKNADKEIEKSMGKEANLHIIIDDIRNIDKYSSILKKVNLIFSYGIFCYLDYPSFCHVCEVIRKYFRGYVVYTEGTERKRIENLSSTRKLRSNTYLHPYLKIFASCQLKPIAFKYIEDGKSFTYVGLQQ